MSEGQVGSEEYTELLVQTYLLSLILGFFRLAWIITGSVMFWRDCQEVRPIEVNTMMWITLISVYAAIGIKLLQGNKRY